MSSTRIGPRGTLTPEVGRWSPVPLHWISKKTIRVVVFHRRRSSHLFYTPYVFSQCQTRVKLNRTVRGSPEPLQPVPRPGRSVGGPAAIHQAFNPRGYGIPQRRAPEVPRLDHLTAREPLGAHARRRRLSTPLKLELSGSSFPADSAKPVPLAVVSLDSR